MRIGMMLKNSGPVSTPMMMADCARAADDVGIDDLWVLDHVAIPPDDAEGSGGRYVDPLATLAWLAGITTRVRLGTGVLIVPYRPALPTAKWLASIQELSAGRLVFGAGAGWMEAEFRALGVPRNRRGAITDDTLAFIHECFANDELDANGQRFIFKPRPPRPEILIGGNGEAALARVARFGDGWMPTEGDPDKLREPIADLTEALADAGKAAPQVIVLTRLDTSDRGAAAARLDALREVGVTGVYHPPTYTSADDYRHAAEALLGARDLMTA